jgi:hypothetical protein
MQHVNCEHSHESFVCLFVVIQSLCACLSLERIDCVIAELQNITTYLLSILSTTTTTTITSSTPGHHHVFILSANYQCSPFTAHHLCRLVTLVAIPSLPNSLPTSSAHHCRTLQNCTVLSMRLSTRHADLIHPGPVLAQTLE